LSGEENPEQIAMRSKRLHLHQENTFLICDVDIDIALKNIAEMSVLPSLIIIDSIQTVRSSDCENAIGSVTQIRESAAKLVQFAKATGIAIVLVGHVTKSGDVAGPRILEHMVDTVLYIEGSEQMDYRLVKSHKNRFGSVAEVGVFTMSEEGMQDVTNPSELFLTSSVTSQAQEGSAVVIIMEGSRCDIFNFILIFLH
jgi:DNA repair protein RadA/Sms